MRDHRQHGAAFAKAVFTIAQVGLNNGILIRYRFDLAQSSVSQSR